ncbi:MAG TPA: DUF4926 domain-containing protein [Tepidisphaeraceae bacterium]|nr:DUF4926 domain-containing protein [Tepidisphaeraceae bacterium]
MRLPEVNDIVRIRADLPDLQLHRGDSGVVRSLWCSPRTAYEVEFRLHDGHHSVARALLSVEQIECDDDDPEPQIADVPTWPMT